MRINLHIKLLLVVCFFSMVSFAQSGREKQLYKLKVIIADSLTGHALEGATVSLTKHKHTHVTNQEGIALFDTLKAGQYHIACTYVGYHSFEQTFTLPEQQVVRVLLCPSSYHLHEAVVEDKSQTAIATYSLQSSATLSSSQIEKLRGQNLGDLLKNVNGMTTLNTGPGIAKPVLRGMHSNRLITLNNGIRQEGQQWGAEHAPEIDPFSVNKVEVVKGASSVEYGPEAIGGAIRLLPREYRKENGIGGEVFLQGFSNNLQGAASALLEGTHFKEHQLSWRVQGTLRKAGDSRAPDYVISNTGFDEQNGSVALAYKYKKLQVEFFGSIFNTKIGIMRAAHIGSSTDLYRAIHSDEPLIIKPFTYDIGKPYQQVWHEIQSVKLYYNFTHVGRLYLQASRQLNSRQEYDLGVSWNPQSVSSTQPAYDLTLTTYTYDAAFEHAKWKRVTGKMGVSVMDQSNYTDGTQKPLIPNFVAYTYGAYVLEKWQRRHWTAEAGVRFDKREQTIYTRNTKQEIVTESKSFQNTTFITGIGYFITDHWKVNSTFSSAWRPPSINELYSDGLHNGTATYEIGDPNLRSERSYNLDINLKHQSEKWVFEISAFHNRISDFIYQLPVQPPTITLRGTFPTFMFTQTNAILQGAEINASYLIHKHVLAGAAISYLHAQDISHDQPLIYMPANRGKLFLQYQREHIGKYKSMFVEGVWQYVAEQTRVPQGLDYLPPPAAYNLFDINTGIEIPLQKQYIRLGLSVKNVFNVSYRDYLNRFRYFTDEPGINIIFRLAVPFTIFTNTKK